MATKNPTEQLQEVARLINTSKNSIDALETTTNPKQLKNSKNTNLCPILLTILLIITLIVILFTLIICLIYYDSQSSNTNINFNDSDLVLPNTTIHIIYNSNQLIYGQFTININKNIQKYDFKSISAYSASYSYESIEFMQTAGKTFKDVSDSWIGFKLVHNDSKLVLKLYHSYSEGIDKPSNTIIISKANQLNATNDHILKAFLGSLLAEYYIELSVKIGSLSLIGNNNNNAIRNIHELARWIFNSVYQDASIDISLWVDLTDEFAKVNSIIANKTNFNRKLLSNDSSESDSNDDNCLSNGFETICGNECFGRCGRNCDCWSWICGDCECHQGCYDHDLYCSCISLYSYCCWNIFWVQCDGSSSCH